MARAPHSAASEGSEGGFTLVELTITIVLMAVAFTALMAGLATFTATSDVHRKQVTTDVVLRDFAEYVKELPYSSCDKTSPYSPTNFTAPTGWSAGIDSVQLLSGAIAGAVIGTGSGQTTPATCAANFEDPGAQIRVIHVASPAGHYDIETTTIIKRAS